MKKLLLGALLLLSTLSFSQNIYSESFGHSILGSPEIYFGTYFFQNQNSTGNCYIHYGSSNSSISVSGGSSGPYTSSSYSQSNNTNASGDGFILLRTNPTNSIQYFQINSVDTSQYSDIVLSFNYLAARDQNVYNIQMTIEQSVDGTNWNNLSFVQQTNTWYNVSIDNIISSPTLYLKFSRTICECANIFGIDDVKITGNVLSTNQNTLTELNIYPNPTNGSLYLSTNTDKNIKIYDMIGNKVIDKDIKNFLDTTNLPIGVYVCEIKEGENKLIKKIVKN